MSALKTFNLSETLPYWELRDGIVINTNRVLEVGILIKPPPTMFFDEAGVQAMNQAIRYIIRETIPQGERGRLTLEAQPLRRPVIEEYAARISTPTPVIRELLGSKVEAYEDLHRRGGIQDWRMYLTCTISNFKKGSDKARVSFDENEWSNVKRICHFVRDRLIKDFQSARIGAEALDNQAMFDMIWRYTNVHVNRSTPPKFVPVEERDLPYAGKKFMKNNPDMSMLTLREQLTGTDVMNETGTFIQIGEEYLSCVSMTGLPDFSLFGMTNKTLPADGNFYLVLDFEHVKQQKETRSLMDKARSAAGMAAGDGSSAFVDPTLHQKAGEQYGALAEMARDNRHIITCGMTIFFTARDKERLAERRNKITSAFQAMPSARVLSATFDCMTQWLLLMPANGKKNQYMRKTLDNTVANLFPLTAPWSGSQKPVAIFGNRFGSITTIDPFDPQAANYNGIVIGGSGSGKSFFMQQLGMEMIKEKAAIYIIDRGYSYVPLIQLAGGAVIPLEPGHVSINCFDLPPNALWLKEHEPAEFEEVLQNRIGFITSLIKTMVPTQDEEKSSIEEAIINTAIRKVYAMAFSEVYDSENNKTIYKYQVPILENLDTALATLTAIGDNPATPEDLNIARRLSTRLQGWIGKSPLGAFVNNETTPSVTEGLERGSVYFETSGFKNYPSLKVVGMMLVADLVWRRVQQDRGERKTVIWDEWGTMLENPHGVKVAVEMFRTARKYNCGVYAVTQTLSDFIRPETQGILQSVSFHFLLRLPGEDDLVQEKLQLSDWALKTFQSLVQRKGEYSEAMAWIRLADRVEGEVIRIQPSREEYWAFTTNPNEIKIREAAVEKHNGDLWMAIKSCAHNLGTT